MFADARQIDSSVTIPARTRRLCNAVRAFDVYRMQVHLTNILYSRMIFVGKVATFCNSVMGTFYILNYFNISSLWSLEITLLTTDAILFWVISMSYVYQIADLLNKILARFRIAADSGFNEAALIRQKFFFRVLKSRLRAIPKISISEGGFRRVHRASMFEFMDFYASQVIAMLLAF